MLALYGALIRVSLLESIQYRFSIIIFMLSRVIQPIVYLSVWNAIAKAQGGTVGGYSPSDFAAYYILIALVNLWSSSANMHKLSRAIESGALSHQLLKPMHPFHGETTYLLGHRVIDSLILVPAMVLLSFLFHPHFTCTGTTLLMAVPALMLAAAIRFMVEAWIGMIAFWTVRTNAANQIYYLFLFFFSGQVGPTKLLPEAAQHLSLLLPFQWMMQFPVDVFLGRLSPAELTHGFLIQGLWVVICSFIAKTLWSRGLKAYTAVGS